MSLRRTVFAAILAIAVAAPVFAEDAASSSAKQVPSVGGIQVEADASQAQSGSGMMDHQGMDSKVNVNTATAKELKAVKGMNAVKARAIVNYRKKHGNFQNIDDIKNVSVFKKMKEEDLKAIEEQLTT